MVRSPYPVLRVWPQDGSSGIWAPADPLSRPIAEMIPYEALGLPNRLVVRFIAWQARFDAGFVPSANDPDLSEPPQEWMDEMLREQVDLARELHRLLGCRVQWDAGGQIWTVGRSEPDADFRTLWRGMFRNA